MAVSLVCTSFGISSSLVLMVIIGSIHSVQLSQGPEPRAPVVEEVVIQVGPRGGAVQGAEAPSQRLGALVAVDVESVVRESVSVVVRLVLLHLDHRGHVALARRRLRVVGGLLDHGVERRGGVVVRVAKQGAVVAGGREDGDVVAKTELMLKLIKELTWKQQTKDHI